jgi:hypothetical protein
VLGPLVVVLTLTLLASGIALLFTGPALRGQLLLVHRASFILWVVVMTVHVLGHLGETARLAPRDFYWRTRNQVAGAGTRNWVLATSLVLGALLAVVMVGRDGHFLAG